MVASISRESLRQILCAGGVSWQATKTRKASADPAFIAKVRRVLDLYDHPSAPRRAGGVPLTSWRFPHSGFV